MDVSSSTNAKVEIDKPIDKNAPIHPIFQIAGAILNIVLITTVSTVFFTIIGLLVSNPANGAIIGASVGLLVSTSPYLRMAYTAIVSLIPFHKLIPTLEKINAYFPLLFPLLHISRAAIDIVYKTATAALIAAGVGFLLGNPHMGALIGAAVGLHTSTSFYTGKVINWIVSKIPFPDLNPVLEKMDSVFSTVFRIHTMKELEELKLEKDPETQKPLKEEKDWKLIEILRFFAVTFFQNHFKELTIFIVSQAGGLATNALCGLPPIYDLPQIGYGVAVIGGMWEGLKRITTLGKMMLKMRDLIRDQKGLPPESKTVEDQVWDWWIDEHIGKESEPAPLY